MLVGHELLMRGVTLCFCGEPSAQMRCIKGGRGCDYFHFPFSFGNLLLCIYVMLSYLLEVTIVDLITRRRYQTSCFDLKVKLIEN